MARKKYFYEHNCGVYQIRNLLDGKVYVGQSIDLKSRKSHHFSSLEKNKHDNIHLQRAYNRDGKENFIFEVLVWCEEFELTRYEGAMKDANNGNCYNMRIVCDSNKGIKFSDETLQTLLTLGDILFMFLSTLFQVNKSSVAEPDDGATNNEVVPLILNAPCIIAHFWAKSPYINGWLVFVFETYNLFEPVSLYPEQLPKNIFPLPNELYPLLWPIPTLLAPLMLRLNELSPR